MTDPELTRRAKAAGVAPCYLDRRGEQVDVSDDTLAHLDPLPAPVRVAGRDSGGLGPPDQLGVSHAPYRAEHGRTS